MRAGKFGTKGPRRGVTLVDLLIGIGVAGASVAAVAVGIGPGCSDVVYPRDVHGRVARTGARLARTEGGMQEKFALALEHVTQADATVRKSAGVGRDKLNVECLSTQCALLEPGQCVELECNHEVRWFEPNVVQCKLERIVECPGEQPASKAQ